MDDKPPKDRSKLRTGFTTGACSAAATKAAVTALVSGRAVDTITIRLPDQKIREATFPVEVCEIGEGRVRCGVRKDAGDDPDCTDKALLCASVEWAEPGVHIQGGDGVGVVHKPGLGLEVGGPAINPVPRKMITECAVEALGGIARGVTVTISVPGGDEMAKKTLNARLGIIGGISILGRTGIVRPYSTAAFRASVVQAIDVAKAQGNLHIALTTGGKSEKFAMKILRAEGRAMPDEAFIQIGDFTGAALTRAVKVGMKRATLCGMMGKFSKIAAGVMQTHAAGSQVDMAFLAELARRAGAPEALATEIASANTGRHVGEMVIAAGFPQFFTALCDEICLRCREQAKNGIEIEAILTDFDEGRVLGRALHA